MDLLLDLPAFVSSLASISTGAPVIALALLGILVLWLALLLAAPKY